MFAAVRVREAEETGETFCRPDDFRVDDYVGSGFRVVSGPDQQRIALRFTPAAAGRAAEKIWHKSQTPQELEDASLIIRVSPARGIPMGEQLALVPQWLEDPAMRTERKGTELLVFETTDDSHGDVQAEIAADRKIGVLGRVLVPGVGD